MGETSRKLSTRLKEHFYALKSKQPHRSAFAAHLLESGHSSDNIEISLLHEENSYSRRLALEALEIARHRLLPVSYTHLTLPTIYSV